MSQSWLSYNFEVLNTKSNVSEQAGFCEKEFVNFKSLVNQVRTSNTNTKVEMF